MTTEWLFVGIKAVKTRVDRAALQSLGEAFAARLQVPFNCPSAYLGALPMAPAFLSALGLLSCSSACMLFCLRVLGLQLHAYHL